MSVAEQQTYHVSSQPIKVYHKNTIVGIHDKHSKNKEPLKSSTDSALLLFIIIYYILSFYSICNDLCSNKQTKQFVRIECPHKQLVKPNIVIVFQNNNYHKQKRTSFIVHLKN